MLPHPQHFIVGQVIPNTACEAQICCIQMREHSKTEFQGEVSNWI
jgi:hypothetical protein